MSYDNAVLRFRVMTEKSKIGFGKYKDFTVHDVIVVEPMYIAYLYYSFEMVSFCQDILTAMNIVPIDKPGVDKDMLAAWNKEYRRQHDDIQKKHHRYAVARRVRRKAAVRQRNETYNMLKDFGLQGH